MVAELAKEGWERSKAQEGHKTSFGMKAVIAMIDEAIARTTSRLNDLQGGAINREEVIEEKTLSEQLIALGEAYHRAKNGSIGLCMECQKPILLQRLLDSGMTAKLCPDCQKKAWLAQINALIATTDKEVLLCRQVVKDDLRSSSKEVKAHNFHSADRPEMLNHGALTSVNNLVALRNSLDEALARVGDGTFGICNDCGERIPAWRLETSRMTAVNCPHCDLERESEGVNHRLSLSSERPESEKPPATRKNGCARHHRQPKPTDRGGAVGRKFRKKGVRQQ